MGESREEARQKKVAGESGPRGEKGAIKGTLLPSYSLPSLARRKRGEIGGHFGTTRALAALEEKLSFSSFYFQLDSRTGWPIRKQFRIDEGDGDDDEDDDELLLLSGSSGSRRRRPEDQSSPIILSPYEIQRHQQRMQQQQQQQQRQQRQQDKQLRVVRRDQVGDGETR